MSATCYVFLNFVFAYFHLTRATYCDLACDFRSSFVCDLYYREIYRTPKWKHNDLLHDLFSWDQYSIINRVQYLTRDQYSITKTEETDWQKSTNKRICNNKLTIVDLNVAWLEFSGLPENFSRKLTLVCEKPRTTSVHWAKIPVDVRLKQCQKNIDFCAWNQPFWR